MATNIIRSVRPAVSLLPPITAGGVHVERVIRSKHALTGEWVEQTYLATGEWSKDAPDASAEHLGRVACLVHDADLVDFMIAEKLTPEQVQKAIAKAPALVVLAMAKAKTDHERQKKAVKAALYRMDHDRLDHLVTELAGIIVTRLKRFYNATPTVLTCSGYGVHAVYHLPSDEGRTDTPHAQISADAARALNRRAVMALNDSAGFDLLDPAVHDCGTRLLREIGSVNLKGAAPRVVRELARCATVLTLRRYDYSKPVPRAVPAPRQAPPPSSGSKGGSLNLPEGYTGDVSTINIRSLFEGAGLFLKDCAGGFRATCPWKEDHGSRATVFVKEGGGGEIPTAVCHHSGHQMLNIGRLIGWFGVELCNGLSQPFKKRAAVLSHKPVQKPAESKTEPLELPPFPSGVDLEKLDKRGPWEEAHFARGSDVEVARAFVLDCMGDHAVFDRESFYRWKPSRGAWVEIKDRQAMRMIQSYDGARVFTSRKDDEVKTRALLLSDGKIQGICKQAAAILDQPGFFEKRAQGCGFLDALVRPDGYAEPNGPQHRLLEGDVLDIKYRPLKGPWLERIPQWARFFSEVFQPDGAEEGCKKAELILQFIGAALLGTATKHEKVLFCVGSGGDGKSTLFSGIQAAFPDSSLCCLAPADMGERFATVALSNARLNVYSDIPDKEIVTAGNFKMAVSGDRISVEPKHKAAYLITPRAAHMFSGNELPPTRDRSNGFWRRWLPVRFHRSFTEEGSQDLGVADRLRSEAAGLAAVAIWFASQMTDAGYTIPTDVHEELSHWRLSEDPVLRWARERISVGGETQSTPLYKDYRSWCMENGCRPLGSKGFSQGLKRNEKKLGIQKKRSGKKAWTCTLLEDRWQA